MLGLHVTYRLADQLLAEWAKGGGRAEDQINGVFRSECGRSDRAIAVGGAQTLTEQGLEALLFAPLGGFKPGKRLKAEPAWAAVHRELRRPRVTLLLLREEYRASHGGDYGYSRWCELYRSWEARLSPTMRQVHAAGERLFVDYYPSVTPILTEASGGRLIN